MPQKKLINDETVLEKALLVISEHGPENFTLADVGKAVGLAPATLMQRFGSKQKLLVLAAKQANIKMKGDLEELKKQQLPWEEELMHLLVGVPDGFGSRQEIANSLSVLKLDMVDPELHPIARDLFNRLQKRIQELLVEGRKSNQLKPSIDTKTTTLELDALRHGLVIQWTLNGKGNLHTWMENGFKSYLKRIKK